MERVIFLDRDGTLNEEVNYLHRKEDLVLLPGVAEALGELKRAGYRLVVVTNQAGVARGYYGEDEVVSLHAYMNELLAPQGAQIDHFFYCPHHPEHGIGIYKKACHCRKPETGMFEMAEQYYEIDKEHSWMIGDKTIDAEERAEAEENLHEGESLPWDFYVDTLLEAVEEILKSNDLEKGTKQET